MSIETQAVNELYQITFQGIVYTFKIAAAAVHEAAALVSLIKKAFEGEYKQGGKAAMNKIIERGGGVTAIPLSKADYKIFQKQAKRSAVLYRGVHVADKKDDTIMVFVGNNDAYRVNKIIEANRLNVAPLASEQPTPEHEEPEATERESNTEPEKEAPKTDAPEQDNEEVKKANDDFFSAFDDEPEEARDIMKEVSESIDNMLAEDKDENPTVTEQAKENQSKEKLKESDIPSTPLMNEKPSVREKTEKIKAEQKQLADKPITTAKNTPQINEFSAQMSGE